MARTQAMVTHFHLEARESAAAVALTTALLAASGAPVGAALLAAIAGRLEPSVTRSRLESAVGLGPDALDEAVRTLGTGGRSRAGTRCLRPVRSSAG